MTSPFIIHDEASRQRVLTHIGNLSLAKGKKWAIDIEAHRQRRTRSQAGLYWVWVDEVAQHVSEHTGYEKDEVHEYLKQRFLEPKMVEIDGDARPRYTTTTLDTKGMADYMDRIYRWASQDLGLILPLPPVATEER